MMVPPKGLYRRPEVVAHLRNSGCPSLRFDELGWRDCDKTSLVVEETLQGLNYIGAGGHIDEFTY